MLWFFSFVDSIYLYFDIPKRVFLMSAIFSIMCGSNVIPLVYNPTTQPAYRLQYNGRFEIEETRVLLHTPDFGPALPIRGFDDNRGVFFNLDVGADNVTGSPICQGFDSPLGAVTLLKRLVDGQNQQALRHHVEKDVDEVFLRVQLDGATNYTDHSILWGFVDDGGAYYDEFGKGSQVAHNATIFLRLEPYGMGAKETLPCGVANGDFTEFTGGLADGFSLVGTPTPVQSTSSYLINGSSQRIVTVLPNEGIDSPTVAITGTQDIIAYVWVLNTTIGSNITIDLRKGAGSLDSAVLTFNDTNEVSDKSQIDTNGDLWYRVPVSANTTGGSVFLRVTASGVAENMFLDGLYIGVGIDSVPSAWLGGCVITNRADGASRNYIDIWGVAGDAPALVTHKITLSNMSTDKRNFIIARGIDGTVPVADQPTWLEDDNFDDTPGDWSTVIDAGRSDGQYIRYTQPAGTGDTTTATFTDATTPTSIELTATTRAVYGIVKVSSTVDTFIELDVTTPAQIFDKQIRQEVNTTGWELIFLGVLNGKGIITDNGLTASQPLTFEFTIDATLGVTVDIDALVLYPIDDDYLLGSLADDLGNAGELWAQGEFKRVITSANGQREPTIIGRAWTLEPGNVVNRLVYTFQELDNEHFLDDTMTIEYEVIPRTRHLLGTV